MSNVYLKKFKDILEAYLERQKELNGKIDMINKTYSTEIAQGKIKEISELKVQAYEGAKDLIVSAFNEVRNLLSYSSFINVEDLTADRLIFESDFILSKQDIQGYLERYSDNYTMKRLIADWVKKQPDPDQYGDINFSLPKDQLEVYKQFAEKALYICDLIFDGKSIMIDPLEITHFEDEIMDKNKLAIIGTGEELSRYKNKRVPESQLHIFDGITLNHHLGKGYEYFH